MGVGAFINFSFFQVFLCFSPTKTPSFGYPPPSSLIGTILLKDILGLTVCAPFFPFTDADLPTSRNPNGESHEKTGRNEAKVGRLYIMAAITIFTRLCTTPIHP